MSAGQAVFRIRIRIRIRVFLGLLDPDPLVSGMDPAKDLDPSITKQKQFRKMPREGSTIRRNTWGKSVVRILVILLVLRSSIWVVSETLECKLGTGTVSSQGHYCDQKDDVRYVVTSSITLQWSDNCLIPSSKTQKSIFWSRSQGLN